MDSEANYIDINRHSWNNRTDAHMKSEFYDLEGFLNGRTSLNDIELNLLGDLNGKSILHLQCHFGQDSISLSRLGAKFTANDLSDKAINKEKYTEDFYAEATGYSASAFWVDDYDWEKYLRLDEGFISSALASLEALQQTWE